MSTRSMIAVQNRTTLQWHAVYCHNDGAHHLPTLETHYATTATRTALMKLGNLSQLQAFAGKPPVGHSFDTPAAGYCVAYSRDRGEPVQRHEYSGIVRLIDAARSMDCDYLYTFQHGRWTRMSLED